MSPSEFSGHHHLEALVPQFAGHSHETATLLSVAVISTLMLPLGPLLLLGLRLRASGGSRLPSRGLGVPPWIRVGVASVLVLVLVVHVWLAVASSSSTLRLVLAFPTALRLALAGVVAFAIVLATSLATALARIFSLKLRRQALLMVALVFIVLPLATECTGDRASVVIRQLGSSAGVDLLRLPLDHEAIPLVAIGRVIKLTMSIAVFTPKELLRSAHDTGMFWGSPLSTVVLVPSSCLAPRAGSPRTVGVQVLVALLLERQLQEEDRQVLVREGPCLPLCRGLALIPHGGGEFGHEPE